MGFLTNAQIEKSLPLVPHCVSLSLERRHRPVLASGPQVVTLQRRLLAKTRYLNGGAGRMLEFNEPVSFLLEFVDLALVGQQAVVLEVLMDIRVTMVIFTFYEQTYQYILWDWRQLNMSQSTPLEWCAV